MTTFEHIQSLLGVAPRSSQQQQPGAADGSGGGIRRQPSGGKPPPHHEQQPHESSGPLKRLLSFVGSRLLSRTSSASSSRSGGGGGAGGGIDVESEGRPLLPVTVQPGGNGAAQGTKDGGGYGNARMGQAAAQRGGGGGESGGSSEKKKPKRPRFLILDFRGVTAVDMSSVANCWFPLQTLCRDLGVVLVYAHCNLRVEFYLRSHRLIDDTNTHLLPTLHQALDFCETALLQVN